MCCVKQSQWRYHEITRKDLSDIFLIHNMSMGLDNINLLLINDVLIARCRSLMLHWFNMKLLLTTYAFNRNFYFNCSTRLVEQRMHQGRDVTNMLKEDIKQK